MMNSTYPQEYLDSAYDQGYDSVSNGVSFPCDTMPSKEKEWWYRGRKLALQEAQQGDT